MANFADYIGKMIAGSHAQTQTPADLMAGIPEGHVNVSGIHVPQGAPQPGQLGSPTNPFSAAQVKTLVAPNQMQYAGSEQLKQQGGIAGLMGGLTLDGFESFNGLGGKEPPKPMSNFDYAQKHGSTDYRAPPAQPQTGGAAGNFFSGGNPSNMLADILGGR